MGAPTLRRPAAGETHRLEVRAEEAEAEVTALRAEGREFADRMHFHGSKAWKDLENGRVETLAQHIAAIIAAAERRRRQTA